MFGFIGRFIGGLWRTANFWRVPPFENPTAGVRVGSPLGGALMFLFLLFAVIAIVLVIAGSLFGFSAGDTLAGVDRWLSAIGPALDFIGKIAIRLVLGIVLAICVITAVAFVFFRKASEAPGWGATIGILLLCLMVGYCSAVNVVAPLEPYDPSVGEAYAD